MVSELADVEFPLPDANVILVSSASSSSHGRKPAKNMSYPTGQIVSIRRQLITELYMNPSARACEMEMKRKCGIWTKEMLRYFLLGDVPAGLDMHSTFRVYESSENFTEYEITDLMVIYADCCQLLCFELVSLKITTKNAFKRDRITKTVNQLSRRSSMSQSNILILKL